MKNNTWIILGVFIVVLVGFLLLQNVEIDSTETPEPTSTPAPARPGPEGHRAREIRQPDDQA